MARIRTNNVFGTTTDNPLTAGATTMNSAGLANLAAVSSNTALITLDPNRVNGAPEIVIVTAHTGSATSATITRAAFGTSAREHPSGTEWEHAPVAGPRPAAGTVGDFMAMDPPACRVTNSTGQSVTNNTLTDLTFDTETYDTDTMHSTSSNTNRITINTAGLYVVHGALLFDTDTDITELLVRFLVNGATDIGQERRAGAITGFNAFNISAVYKFAAADYVTLNVRHVNSSAGANSVTLQKFSATWIGTGD